MPDIVQALDANRFREIGHDGLLGANLWLSLCLAAERGDKAAVRHACEQIRTLTRTTFSLVNGLGSEDPDAGLTPFAKEAKAWRQERDSLHGGLKEAPPSPVQRGGGNG